MKTLLWSNFNRGAPTSSTKWVKPSKSGQLKNKRNKIKRREQLWAPVSACFKTKILWATKRPNTIWNGSRILCKVTQRRERLSRKSSLNFKRLSWWTLCLHWASLLTIRLKVIPIRNQNGHQDNNRPRTLRSWWWITNQKLSWKK